eukprot:1130789-Prymnesium_polylepis.1
MAPKGRVWITCIFNVRGREMTDPRTDRIPAPARRPHLAHHACRCRGSCHFYFANGSRHIGLERGHAEARVGCGRGGVSPRVP